MQGNDSETSGGLSGIGRGAIFAGVGLVLAVIVIAFIVRGGGYEVNVRFESATQMVKGNEVRTGGRTVGTVEKIELTENGQAQLTLKLDDDNITPLREGTIATLRLASLSGVANRYVDLQIPNGDGDKTIADGGVIDTDHTTAAVDIDQFFNLFDAKTRRGLRDVIRGSARQYVGVGEQANAGWKYIDPSLLASQRLFAEINRDTPLLEQFVVASSRLVTDVADRDNDLSALVDRLATTTGAIAASESQLTRAIGRLPSFMKRANTTFVNLRATLDDADPLVTDSLPVTPKLRAVLAQLRPLASEARPTISDLATVVRKAGKDNDLIDLGKATLPLRQVAVGPVTDNGKSRPGSLPTATKAFAGQRPQLAFLRPYSVDLTGWFDDFSHSGVYDANGSASRSALSVNVFSLVGGLLQPIPPELRNAAFDAVATLDQRNRCPGSAERPAPDKSNPWVPANINCDPTQLPPGK